MKRINRKDKKLNKITTELLKMPEGKSSEEVYLNSVIKLRLSFPKFVIFLGVAFIVWLIGTSFIFPLSKGSLGSVDALSIESLILIAAVLVLIFLSFIEIKNVADASAGLIATYITKESNVEEVRLMKIRRSLRTTFYIIPTVTAYIIFSKVIEQIYAPLNTIIPILIVLWVVIASIFLAMVLGLELDEASRLFIEKLGKLRRKKANH